MALPIRFARLMSRPIVAKGGSMFVVLLAAQKPDCVGSVPAGLRSSAGRVFATACDKC